MERLAGGSLEECIAPLWFSTPSSSFIGLVSHVVVACLSTYVVLCGVLRLTHVCVLRAVLCNLNGSLFSRKWQLLVAVTPKNPVCHWEKWKHQRPRRSQLGWLFVMATARIGPIFLKIRKEIPPRGGGKTTYFAGVCDLPRSAVKNTLRANIYYKFCK